jgi:hypothetical protein
VSTAIAIGASTLQLPDPGESYSLPLLNQNFTNIANEQNNSNKLHHFEAYRPSQTDAPANTLWGPGVILSLRDASASSGDDFTAAASAGTTDGVKLTKEGVYTVTFAIGNAGLSPVTLWHIICGDGTSSTNANNTVLGRSPAFSVPSGDWYYAYASNFYVNSSGKEIFFKYSAGTASPQLTHRIRITKVQ